MRLICSVLASAALVLTLGAVRSIAQTEPTAAASALRSLEPSVNLLRQAIQAGDFDEALKLVTKLNLDISKINRTIYTPDKNLEALEKRATERPESRPRLLPYLAVAAMRTGDSMKAKAYATETLAQASGLEYEGESVFYGNQVLGLLALEQGDVAAATQYLDASATTKGWARLARFGPNLSLANALLERGERDAVLDYLERFKPLWPNGAKTLAQWQAVIRANATPDFGTNRAVLP